MGVTTHAIFGAALEAQPAAPDTYGQRPSGFRLPEATHLYPGALFLGAGGYYHHLGTNVWAGPSATPSSIDDARLVEWTIELPNAATLADAAHSVSLSGHPLSKSDAGDISTRDPWGTTVRLRVSDDPRRQQ